MLRLEGAPRTCVGAPERTAAASALAAPLMRPRPLGEAGAAGPGPISACPSTRPVPPRLLRRCQPSQPSRRGSSAAAPVRAMTGGAVWEWGRRSRCHCSKSAACQLDENFVDESVPAKMPMSTCAAAVSPIISRWHLRSFCLEHVRSECFDSSLDVPENGLAVFCHSIARIVARTRGRWKASEVFYGQCCNTYRMPIFAR